MQFGPNALKGKVGEYNMTYVVIGRTVYKGKELEFKEPLPYYMESQAETLIESAKRRIRIRYHSEYPYSKARLSYSFVKNEGTVKPEKAEKKSIFGAVKAVGARVITLSNKRGGRNTMNASGLIKQVKECRDNDWKNSDIGIHSEEMLEAIAEHLETCVECRKEFDAQEYIEETLIEFEKRLNGTELSDWVCGEEN